MSLKRSQNFIYFQNKAHHYQNIQTARPRVESSLPGHLKRSLENSKTHHNRDMPYNKRYEIEYQNKNLANRILSISHAARKSLNPYKDEEMRNITLQNDKILKHIDQIKPRIGANEEWNSEYRSKSTYKKLLCKYDDALKSKEQLLLQLSPSKSDKKLPFTQGQSSHRPRHVRIQKEKLFILPSFSPIEPLSASKEIKKSQQQTIK